MNSVSRADLLRVLNAEKDLDFALDNKALARLFRFEYDPKKVQPSKITQSVTQSSEVSITADATVLYTASSQQKYWYVAACQPKQTEKLVEISSILSPTEVEEANHKVAEQALAHYALLSAGQWQNIWDQFLVNKNTSQLIDVPRAVQQITQGEPIRQMPKMSGKHWNKSTVLMLDRSKPLRPVWPDMRAAWLNLLALMGKEHLQTFYLSDGPSGYWSQPDRVLEASIDSLTPGAKVVLIGAFGALATGRLSAEWRMLFDELQTRGHELTLLPVCTINNSTVRQYPLDARPQQQSDTLLTALALAWKPTLNQLRHLRLAIPDATLQDELYIYNHPDVEQLGANLNLKPELLMARLQQFEDLEVAAKIRQCVAHWQTSLSPTAREIERLQSTLYKAPQADDYVVLQGLAKAVLHPGTYMNLSTSIMRSMLPVAQLLARQPANTDWQTFLHAAQKVAILAGRPLPLQHVGLQSSGALRYLRQVERHLILTDSNSNGLLQLGTQAYCVQTQKIIYDDLPGQHQTLDIIDQGYAWQLQTLTQPDWSTRFWQNQHGLFAVHGENALFYLQAASAQNPQAQWVCQHNPWSWASSAGIDEFGLWADLQVKHVIYRLRWIKPGQFMMGSPEEEKGRDDDEKQHLVTLRQSYWLGQTSCTQALWQAVMEDNPSYFQTDLQLPVEQISWHDCQTFFARLLALLPDFPGCLPTEAQWEYACRAGTTSAYWWGDDFEAAYANKGSQTEVEMQYPANEFGLKSMSGNVREWCADWFGDYSIDTQIDPSGASESQGCVLRGGGWFGSGRGLRSAGRVAYGPSYRDHCVGFRLAGGIDPQASKPLYTADRGPWNGQAGGRQASRG